MVVHVLELFVLIVLEVVQDLLGTIDRQRISRLQKRRRVYELILNQFHRASSGDSAATHGFLQ
jgi:hypothetical protein